MKTFGFSAESGLVFVSAEMTGPSETKVLKLVLDTGATRSIINRVSLLSLGIDLNQFPPNLALTTGSQQEVVTLVVLTRLSALGLHRSGFSVLAHTLPPNAAVDGLLGLDFLRDHVLTLDLPAGQIHFD